MPKAMAARPPKRKPKLGQHFLNSDAHALKIVEALGDISGDTVLEIGPGGGALTALLARRAQRLIAVEVDRVLAAQLRLQFAMSANVEILEADILGVDVGSLLGPRPGTVSPGQENTHAPVKVVGNLPYFLTSDILLRLFANARHFSVLVLMVQKEVAERLAAEPGGREFGLLSATAQMYGSVEKILDVPRGAFSPPPDVDSAVLRINIAPRFAELGVEPTAFIDFLKLAFAQKRKTIFNNLREHYGQEKLRAALSALKVSPSSRAEALSLEQLADVFKAAR